jgi:hypothetical protein
MSTIFTPSDKLIEEFHRRIPSASTAVPVAPVAAVVLPEEKPKPLSKSALRSANRHIQKALKHLGKACELTGRNKIEVSYEVTLAAPRPPAPPETDTTMTPQEFRELDRTNTYDTLLIAACFPSCPWEIPARDLEYATVGSGDAERFISPPRATKEVR